MHDHSDKGDSEDEQETDLKQPRKQSEASEKIASRKNSRVSTHDHSGKEDEKEDAEEGNMLIETISIFLEIYVMLK